MMRKKLLILCYHGFELQNESQFRPKLFINQETFRRRLKLISKYHFPVLPLSDALNKLQHNALPSNGLVISIDDGFYSTFKVAADILASYRYPATIYITTYYVQKVTPIFRLAVQYMFWKTKVQRLPLHALPWATDYEVELTDAQIVDRIMWQCIDYGEQQCTDAQREELSATLGHLLGVEYHKIKDERLLSLMTQQEVGLLAHKGFDIQLHTHRHDFPVDDEATATKEIIDNKQVLETIVGRSLVHFCYPSGVWDARQWPWLKNLDIQSAATCLPGLNDAMTPHLGLKRFLDGENISQIEFEAELFGFMELVRQMWTGVRHMLDITGSIRSF